MGYRIIYESAIARKTKAHGVPSRKQYVIFWSVFLLIVFSICWLGWNKTNIRYYLLPGDPDVTGTAIEDMIDEIRSGAAVSDAVSAFCKVIVNHATLK